MRNRTFIKNANKFHYVSKEKTSKNQLTNNTFENNRNKKDKKIVIKIKKHD